MLFVAACRINTVAACRINAVEACGDLGNNVNMHREDRRCLLKQGILEG